MESPQFCDKPKTSCLASSNRLLLACAVQNGDVPLPIRPSAATKSAVGTGTLCGLCERKIILLLSVLASIHIFIFSTAFPPGNNVDEYLHFDLALIYSHGQIPRGANMISEEGMKYTLMYGSCEYNFTPDYFPGNKYPPPPWTLPPTERAQALLANRPNWERPNYESSQPPLYYVLAGFWWHVGHWVGMKDQDLFFWMRLLDIPLVVALICLAYATARFVFPENVFIRIAVPAFIAFMPQSEFYSVDNDVLSPLGFGLVFLFLLKWLQEPTVKWGIAMGLAFAATYLAKTTNVPLLAVICAAVALKTAVCIREGKWGVISPALASFIYCAFPPIILWMYWCKFNYGDWIGQLNNVHYGLSIKPFKKWFHHPIYSPHGVWTYLSGQMGTFWQGEFWWHGQFKRLCLPGTDVAYTLLSLILTAAAVPALFRRSPGISLVQRMALQTGLACVLAALGFYAVMSVIYQFSAGSNPSIAYPYFHQGRMFLGILIPFLFLFVYGLDRLLDRFGTTTKFVTVAVMILTMLALETVTDWPAFSSQYNWFHMP